MKCNERDDSMNTFEFAINMELDGEKYYTGQAEMNEGNSLKTVFLMLAKDERNHSEILKKKQQGLSCDLKAGNTLSESENVFKGIGDFKNDIRQTPNQLELYRAALGKEKQSIDLYEGFLLQAADDKSKGLFEYLIKQEEDHLAVIEELVTLINRADEWVESAEFGIRQDY